MVSIVDDKAVSSAAQAKEQETSAEATGDGSKVSISGMVVDVSRLPREASDVVDTRWDECIIFDDEIPPNYPGRIVLNPNDDRLLLGDGIAKPKTGRQFEK